MVFTLHAFLNTDNEQIYVKKKNRQFLYHYIGIRLQPQAVLKS